jgi:hypothetical protein
MNLEQVSHYIAHPHELGLHEAPALKELSEKHPYAAVFSLLYLTALANGKSIDLDAALQQHAYRLSDRTKLYHLLNAPLGETTSAAAQEEAITSPFGEGSRGILHEPASENPGIQKASLPQEEPTAPVEMISEPGEAPAEQETVPEIPETTFEQETASEEPPSFDRVTEAFTREQHFDIPSEPEEITDAYSAPGTDNPGSERSDSTEEEETPVIAFEQYEDEGTPVVTTVKQTAEAEEEPAAEEIPTIEKEVEKKEQPASRSFTSWLKSGSGETASVPETAENEPLTENEQPVKKRADDIIDNFIKEEPKITRSKAEFFSPSRKAKESLDEDAVPVSETLAKIYAAQGNYPKAIHVYHQLMLSFPEKKSLFAVQIEALKKKITA